MWRNESVTVQMSLLLKNAKQRKELMDKHYVNHISFFWDQIFNYLNDKRKSKSAKKFLRISQSITYEKKYIYINKHN